MHSKDEIAFKENWYRQKALKDYRELYPDDNISAKEFFKNGSVPNGSNSQKKPSKEDYKKKYPTPAEAPKSSPKGTKKPFSLQSKGSKDRRFLVDSGASFHLVSKESLSQKERKSVSKLPFPIEIQTANGTVFIKECCDIYVHDLGIKLKAMLLNDTIAVLSLGRLVEDNQFKFDWHPGGQATLISPDGKSTRCPAQHNVPFIFPSSENLAELENEAEQEEIENVPPPPVPEVQREPKRAENKKSLG
jgi:hypothetical protein